MRLSLTIAPWVLGSGTLAAELHISGHAEPFYHAGWAAFYCLPVLSCLAFLSPPHRTKIASAVIGLNVAAAALMDLWMTWVKYHSSDHGYALTYVFFAEGVTLVGCALGLGLPWIARYAHQPDHRNSLTYKFLGISAWGLLGLTILTGLYLFAAGFTPKPVIA